MPLSDRVTVLSGPVIRAGESLSESLEVTAGNVYSIMMPDEWDSADITLQISMDGVKFYNVYDEAGKELVMPCVPKSIVPLGRYLMYAHSIKIRSGALASRDPVVQSATRAFGIVIDTYVGAIATSQAT